MARAPASSAGRADYGLDAPGVVRAMILGGTAGVVLGVVLTQTQAGASRGALFAIGSAAVWIGGSYLLSAGLMVVSSRVGKLRERRHVLDSLGLRENSRLLDVGCGHGLLLIGAAQRMPRGEAVGIDLWSQRDQGDNSAAATLANAAAEGVADRVVVEHGDMRALPFPDASFDAVVSSLAIHNLPRRDDRRRAITEIVRVLRPGGVVAITDIAHAGQYAADLRGAGMRDVVARGFSPWIFPPARRVVGRK